MTYLHSFRIFLYNNDKLKKYLEKVICSNFAFTFILQTIGHEPKNSDYEKLKQVFNNTEATLDEQKRIKIAFVEGYESGMQRQMRGRTMWLRIVQNMIAVSVVIFVIWLYRMYKRLHF